MHSSGVSPCPFAPGTSAQYATYHGPSRSMIAVNSLRMHAFYTSSHSSGSELDSGGCHAE